MKVEDLPTGAWVDLKEPEDLTYGERRPLERTSARMWQENQKRNGQVDTSPDTFDMPEVAMSVLISGWSYDMPIPAEDPTSLFAMPARDVDKLRIIVLELLPRMFLNTEVDPESFPTSPSLS